MATATVIIPQLTTLMTGTGAHHIAFSNLILEHEASTQFDSSYGFATAFVNALCGPVPNCTSITDAGNPNMPAAITFDGASHDISFTNTAISHNADRGLWFKEGFQHASVTLNQFLDNGGGAWQFGGRNDGNQSNAALQTCCGDFENNQVDGEYQFHGVAPVAAGYYRDTVISHNALLGYGVLGTGFGFYYIPVHIGWIGAASDTPGYTANNTTNYNQVLGACQGSNQGASPNTATDCAAFHSNGAELNSFAEFNDFQHMGTSLQTCLYLDNATSNLTAEFNDCAYGGGTSGWAFINSTNGGPLLATGNTVTNNCNGLTSTGFTDFGTSNTTSPNYNYTSGSPPSTHPPTPSCTEIIAGAGVVGSPGPH
jgi:hypothetical protein